MAEAYLRAKFHFDPSNRLARVHERHRQTGQTDDGPIAQSEPFYKRSPKTVRHMLSDRCLVCLSVLSVTLVYCGQTVGWIKMKLGTHGYRPRPWPLFVGWRPSSPPQKGGGASQFSAHVYCGQTTAWIMMALGMEMGFGPGHIVLDGDSAPLLPKEAEPPNIWPISIVAKRLYVSGYHLVRR